MIWARNITIVLLVASTLSSSFLVPLIYLDFEVRRDYIEKVLCIDRDKPITICKGSCVLNERLDFAREQGQKEQEAKPIEIVFFFIKDEQPDLNNHFSLLNQQKSFDYSSSYESHIQSIFHPPSV